MSMDDDGFAADVCETKICRRCEKDVNPEPTMDCNVCKVYGLCMECAKAHDNVCLLRWRQEDHTPRAPATAATQMPMFDIIDSPVFWIVAMGITFGAFLLRMFR